MRQQAERLPELGATARQESDRHTTRLRVHRKMCVLERRACILREHDRTQTWKWVEQLDKTVQRYYYYDHFSRELYQPDPWEQPEDYVMAFEDAELRAALRLQGFFRAMPKPSKSKAWAAEIAAAEAEEAELLRLEQGL